MDGGALGALWSPYRPRGFTDRRSVVLTMPVVSQDRFGGPEVLHVREAKRPTPRSTDVLVQIRAAGLNPVG